MKYISVIALLMLASTSIAGPPLPGNLASCYHNNDSQKVSYGCLEDLYEDIVNVTTYNGEDGQDGINGKDGVDGVVDRAWYTQMNQYLAATTAAQAYLPQNTNSRLTFGVSSVGRQQGIGLGVALISDGDHRTAFTISIGKAGSTSAGVASIGWEF